MAEDNFSKKEGLNSIPNSRQSIFDSQRMFNATEVHPYSGKLKMSPLHSFVRRMKRTLTKRGLIGSMQYSVIRTFRYIQNQNLSPSMKHAKAVKKKAGEKFDRINNINTCGDVLLHNLDIKSKSWIYGCQYEPIGLVDFGEIFKKLNIPYEKFVFIDLGSGKGRAILLASALQFKKIIGVEFCEELNRIAENNICCYPDKAMKCRNIEIICNDASTYNFPDEPLILFMYHPFESPVMIKVIENVTATFKKSPRRIVVVYFNPKYSELLDSSKFLERIITTPEYHIYDTQP